MTQRSWPARLYHTAALLALLNLAMVGVGTGYVWATGRMDRAKLAAAMDALFDRKPLAKSTTTKDEPRPDVQPKSLDRRAVKVESPGDLDLLQHQADRILVELDQQLALVNSIMLKVTQEREAFKSEQARARQPDESLRARRQEGFKKQVEIYEGLAPKIALEHLLGLEDIDHAARILIELDARTTKKIVEAAKDPEKLKRVQAILHRVQDVASEQTAAMEQGSSE